MEINENYVTYQNAIAILTDIIENNKSLNGEKTRNAIQRLLEEVGVYLSDKENIKEYSIYYNANYGERCKESWHKENTIRTCDIESTLNALAVQTGDNFYYDIDDMTIKSDFGTIYKLKELQTKRIKEHKMNKTEFDIRNLAEIHTKFGTLYRENLETSMVEGEVRIFDSAGIFFDYFTEDFIKDYGYDFGYDKDYYDTIEYWLDYNNIDYSKVSTDWKDFIDDTECTDLAEMLNSGFVNMVGKYYILING